MKRVVVIGGYGHLGSLCVQELAETFRSDLVIAGRSVQQAERAAIAAGATGAYADASDPRTLAGVLDGAACVLVCSGPECTAVIEHALKVRTPLVVASDPTPESSARAALAEAAWNAQVPLVTCAGAIPGLVGICAEQLVRSLEEVARLRICCTGPWRGTPTADADVGSRWGAHPVRWFELPTRRVRLKIDGPLSGVRLGDRVDGELARFCSEHLVGHARYLEPRRGPLASGLDWVAGEPPPTTFQLRADAHGADDERAFVDIGAPDPVRAAAVSLAALVREVLEGKVAPGLVSPREATNPGTHLALLEKRGLEVSVGTSRERANG